MIHTLGSGPELQLSERLVYKGLIQFGELTTSELVKHTGGSQSSVYRILCALVDRGLVVQSPATPRSGNGRRPIAYSIKPEASYLFGAYLRWDVFGIGLCTVDGAVVSKAEAELELDTTPTDVVSFMASEIERMLDEHAVSREQVSGLGLSTTGPLLKDKGILFHPHHIDRPHWEVVPIRDMLEMATSFSVAVNNLASAGLLGELMKRRRGLGDRSSYVLLDVGVGTDTFYPGAVDRTFDDQSGSLGRMVIDHANDSTTVANYVSIDAIYERFLEAFPGRLKATGELSGGTSVLRETDAKLHSVRALIDDLSGEDKARAQSVLSTIAGGLAAGIMNFVDLLNPRVIYYGGRVVREFPDMVRDAFDRVKAKRPAGFVSPLEFVRSDLDDELLIRGAVYHVLDEQIGLFMPVGV